MNRTRRFFVEFTSSQRDGICAAVWADGTEQPAPVFIADLVHRLATEDVYSPLLGALVCGEHFRLKRPGGFVAPLRVVVDVSDVVEVADV